MKWKQRITHNTYVKLLVILLCIAILPSVTASILSYQVSTANARQQSEAYSQRLLEQIVSANDITFEQMQAFIYEIMISFDGYSDVLSRLPYTADFLRVRNTLDNKRQAYQMHISNFVIFDMQSNKIITSRDSISVYDIEDYRQRIDENLTNMILSAPPEWQINDLFLRNLDHTQKVLTYIVQLGQPGQAKGYIAIDIEAGKFTNLDSESDHYGSLYMRNSSGMLLSDRHLERFEASRAEETRNQYVVISQKSSISGVQYDYVIAKSSFNENNALLLKSILYIALGLVLLGAFVAWLSTKNIYTPLRDLLNYIRQLTGEPLPGSSVARQDEYTYLEQAFTKMNKEKMEYMTTIRNHQSVFKQRQLNYLLVGNLAQFHALEVPEKLKLRVEGGQFAVMVIEIEDTQEFRDKYTLIEQQLMYYAIENISEEILSGYGNGTVAHMEPYRITAMFNFATDSLTAEQLVEIGKLMMQQIHHYLHIFISIGISEPTDDLTGLKLAAEQASRSLAYRAYYGKNSIISYPHVAKPADEPMFASNPAMWNDIREQLKTAFRTGEEVKADKAIMELIDEVSHIGITEMDVQFVFMQFVTCLSDVCTEFSLPLPDVFGEHFSIADQVYRLSTMVELEQQMREMTSQLLDKLGEKKSNVHRETVDKLLIYIKENIENNLTLDIIAEKAYMHPAYLSRIFKALTGYSLGEQIVMAKINRAKQLLENGNEKVGHIAERLGYTTPRAFYRIFKDYTGFTPSDYRKHIGLKNMNE